MPTDAEWVIRAATPEDQSLLTSMWLKSYAHSRYGRERGANRDFTSAEIAYRNEHVPLCESLLASAETLVTCDPERPDIVWAFACMEPETVHYFAVKRAVVEEMCALGKEGHRDARRKEREVRAWRNGRDDSSGHGCTGEQFAQEMLTALLGKRLGISCGMTHELPWRDVGLRMPTKPDGNPLWYLDTTFFGRKRAA